MTSKQCLVEKWPFLKLSATNITLKCQTNADFLKEMIEELNVKNAMGQGGQG